MSNVALANPQSVTGKFITHNGSAAGLVGVDASCDFHIKVVSFQNSFVVPTKESSGDGDNAPCHAFSLWMYAGVVLDGLLLAASISPFVLANLILPAKNPIAALNTKFHLASGHVLTFPKIGIRRAAVAGENSRQLIRLQLDMIATDEHPTWGAT